MNKKNSIFFDTSLIYFIVVLCLIGTRIFSYYANVNNVISVILNLIIQIGIMLFLPFILYKTIRKKTSKQALKEFNVKKISFKAVLITILIGIIIYFLNIAVASFFNIFIYSTGYDPSFGMSSASETYSVWAFLLDVFLSAILPGICEEFCHRGLLLNGYKQLNIKKTIILVGFLFGLVHLNIQQFFYASIIGMFLTFLVYVTGSIIPSMIVHFMNNFIGLYLSFAEYNNLPFGNFSSNLENVLQSGDPFYVFMVIIFVVVFLLGLLAFLVYKLMKNTRVKQFELLAKKAIDKKQREELFKEFNLDPSDGDQYDNIPEVVIADSISPNGKRGMIVDINVSNNLLEGDYFIAKPTLRDKIFLYGTIFMGIAITFSTLIWGIL